MAAAKTAPTVEPLARRDELLVTLARVDERGDDHDLKHREATAALDDAERTLAEVRIGEVTGGATPTDVQRATTAREKARAALEILAPDRTAIDTARKRTEKALIRLYLQHREAFEAEAERTSRSADEAIAQLAPHLCEAAESWAEAQGAWARLTRWLNHVDAPHLDREHQLGRVPDFPIKLSVGAVQPRPHERRNGNDTTELIADRIAVFADERKGDQRRAVVGSMLWREMVAESRFRFLRYEEPRS